MSFRQRLYLSTIGEDAPALARRLGLGLEVAEYCTAWRMDREFPATPTGKCARAWRAWNGLYSMPLLTSCAPLRWTP